MSASVRADWSGIGAQIDAQYIALDAIIAAIQASIDLDPIALHRVLREKALASDALIRSIGKALTDVSVAQDAIAAFSVLKPFTETITAEDVIRVLIVVARPMSDAAIATDALAFGTTKAIEGDVAEAFDALSLAPGKRLAELAAATDTISTIDLLRAMGDSATAVELRRIITAKPMQDTLAAGDAGLLKQHDYCDLTYFAEDYTGTTRSF